MNGLEIKMNNLSTISIRIDEETKEQLEELEFVSNMNRSDLIRKLIKIGYDCNNEFKYINENYTYIVNTGKKYKIGKTMNPERRL